MARKSFFARRWKLILNIVTLLALAGLVYATRDQLMETVTNLRKVNVWVLLLIIPLEALSYHSQARMYQRMFGIVGTKISYKNLIKASLELNFVNHVFPSGGVSGISYFGLRMKSFGARPAQSTSVQTMKLVLLFLSFEVLLLPAMFILSIHGSASNLTTFIGTSIAMVVLAGTALFAYIIGSKSRINAFFTVVTKAVNRVIQIVRPRHPETININKAKDAFTEFHETYVELRSRWRELIAPFWWAVVGNLVEVLVIYVVYIAFGDWVDIGAIVLAYGIANVAGLVSVLPGGVGVYEGLMTTVLATAGISPGVSLPVTVMYRILNTALQIPPGYYFYNRFIRKAKLKTEV